MSRKKRYYNGLEISKKTNVVLNIFMFLVAAISLYPLLLMFSVSITDETAISMNGYRLFPSKISFYAYEYIFHSLDAVVRGYGITMFTTVVGALLSVAIMAMYAYPLSRSSFKYKNSFSFFVYFTMLFGGGLVPWYIMYVKMLHLKNTIWVMIIPYLVTAVHILIIRTFYRTSVPEEIIEAAKIDGAGEFYTFCRIVLPLSKPVMGTIMLFSTLKYWNDWYLPMIFITDEKMYTLQYLLYKLEKNIEFLVSSSNVSGDASMSLALVPSESSRMALAILVIGPIIFAYPFFQKYLKDGMTIGAVKG
ncbi:MAG: carbohydrate ABC transporter permease [Angelakisella sp.]